MRKVKKGLATLLALPMLLLPVACEKETSDNGLPFKEPLEKSFNYCPSVIEEADGTRFVFYCATKESGIVQDHIYCRKGTKNGKGGYTWSEKTLVLSPRYFSTYFDNFHCCDPCVIAGNFTYNGEPYKYLMAYTGNSSNINNKVGLAVSNSPMSGWVALEEPLVTYSGDASHWGVGQPSMVSVDKQGIVQLVYSVGGNSTYNMSEQWDFSDLNNPVRLTSNKITEKGLLNLKGGRDYLSNVDIAFDETTNRYYIVSDCHPNPTDGEPSFVGSHFRINYMTERSTFGTSLSESYSKSWMNLAQIGPSETGFQRNSNCGIVRDEYGRLLNSEEIEIFYSMSEVKPVGYEWTYRIYSYKIAIEE